MAMHQSRPKSMVECSGPECSGCGSAQCMAEGGNVNYSGNPGHSKANEKGIHSDIGGGMSKAGAHARSTQPGRTEQQKERGKGWSKEEHERVLGDMRSMKKPNLYADGGRVKGVQDPYSKWHITEPGGEASKGGVSIAGHSLRHGGEWGKEGAKEDHRRGIRELKDMGKRDRTNLAEGGEVESGSHEMEDGEPEMHEELRHAMGEELMSALERKDKKGIMDALEACVLSIKGRHE